jgi:hypothetical protein
MASYREVNCKPLNYADRLELWKQLGIQEHTVVTFLPASLVGIFVFAVLSRESLYKV